jgi:hypothetical protein
MPNYWQIAVLTALGIGSFIGGIQLQGTPPSNPFEWFGAFSTPVTVVSVVIALFHLGLWRVLPFWLAPKPDLNGTWKVTLTPWPVPVGTSATSLNGGFMFVKQHYYTLSMRLETATTWSELVAEQIITTKGGAYQLWAIYLCEPRPDVDPGRERPHYGAMMLRYIEDGEEVRLKGRYWVEELTDSTGKKLLDGGIELCERKGKRFHDYEAAIKGYGLNPRTIPRSGQGS